MVNLFLFILLIALVSQLGFFLVSSVMIQFFLQLSHYLGLFSLLIIFTFFAWCFSED